MISRLEPEQAVKIYQDQIAQDKSKQNRELLLASIIFFEQKGIFRQTVTSEALINLISKNDLLSLEALKLLSQDGLEKVVLADKPLDIRKAAFKMLNNKENIIKSYFTSSAPEQKSALGELVVHTEEYKKYLNRIKSVRTVFFRLLMYESDASLIPKDSIYKTEQAMKIILMQSGYDLVPESSNENFIEIFLSTYPCGEYLSEGSGTCLKSTLSLFDKYRDTIFTIYSDSGPLPEDVQNIFLYRSNSDKNSVSAFKQVSYNISEEKLLRQIKKDLKQLKKLL